jgi:hypothetical protein
VEEAWPPRFRIKETYSLARACHASMRGCWRGARRLLEDAKDADEPSGEVRVIQNLAEKHRFRSKDFVPTTKPKIVADTVEEDGGNRLVKAVLYWKKVGKIP